MKGQHYSRNYQGQIPEILVIVLVMVGIAFGAMGVDFCHMLSVRNELQNATDAGALAGAQDLNFNIGKAEADGRAVAALNCADGRSVSSNTAGCTVDVTVTPPKGTTPGQVQMTASMKARHLFAPFFDRFADTIKVTSIASTSGKLWMISSDQLFPLAVSLDVVPKDKGWTGKALNQYNPGDTFTIYLKAQGVKNASFSSLTVKPASAEYIRGAVNQCIGLSPVQPGYIPAVKIGDEAYLNNGMIGETTLAKDPANSALLAQKSLVVALVHGNATNQSGTVVGFMAIQPLKVTVNSQSGVVETIDVKIIGSPPPVNGISGPIPTTGSAVDDAFLAKVELAPIHLIR
jgi:Flp pilus assembly protein TadG